MDNGSLFEYDFKTNPIGIGNVVLQDLKGFFSDRSPFEQAFLSLQVSLKKQNCFIFLNR